MLRCYGWLKGNTYRVNRWFNYVLCLISQYDRNSHKTIMSFHHNTPATTDNSDKRDRNVTEEGRSNLGESHGSLKGRGRRRSAVGPPGPTATSEKSLSRNVIVWQDVDYDAAVGDQTPQLRPSSKYSTMSYALHLAPNVGLLLNNGYKVCRFSLTVLLVWRSTDEFEDTGSRATSSVVLEKRCAAFPAVLLT